MKICPVCQRRYPDNTLHCPEDGSVLQLMSETPVEEESLIGKRLFGEYTVTKKLGEGGMGAVYMAEQDSIGQKIALKVLHGRSSQNDELLKRFVREANAVSRLNHPNIIRIFIFGRTPDGLVYLAMEFVQGKDLRDTLDEGRMDELRAIRIMKQTLSAVNDAHEEGIVHRDLKPDNILLTHYRGSDDFVKVLDFGIAKVKEPDGKPQQQLTQAGVVYGTPEYLSPEQAQALELDHRTDIYSLGVILYEMMTGQVPFASASAVKILTMHVFETPKRPSEINPDIAPEMELIILKAMSKKPAMRYATAMEFFEDLTRREEALMRERDIHEAQPIFVPGAELLTSAGFAPLKRSTSPEIPTVASAPVQTTQPPAQGATDETPSASIEAQSEGQKTNKALLIAVIVLSVVALLVLIAAVILGILYMKKGG